MKTADKGRPEIELDESAEALERLRDRARAALRAGHFDLAEELIARGDANTTSLIENLRVYQAELEIQNEELLQSQVHAARALERFTALFHGAPIAELLVDQHWIVLDANPAAVQLFRLRNLRAHRHFLLRLVDERDRDGFLDLMKAIAVEGTPQQERLELRFTSTDGTVFFGDLHAARLPDTDDGEPRFLCAVVDRTAVVEQRRALQRAHDRLAESQEAYRVLTEFSIDWDYWLGPDGRLIYTSPGCHRVSGYGASAFIDDPKLMQRLLHPDDRPAWQAHLDSIQTCGNEARCDGMLLRLRHHDGSWRWIEHACRPVTANDGRYLGQRAVMRDVTALQQANAKRLESEHRYRALFESAAEPMLLLQEAKVTKINPAALAMLGYESPEAILGKRPDQFSPPFQPNGRSSAAEVDRLLSETAGKSLRFEWLHQRSDSAQILVEVTLVPVQVDTAQATLVHWSDRTEVAQARQREIQASTIFEHTDEAIMLTDPDRRISVVNSAFTRITGYEEAAVVGHTPAMLGAGHDEGMLSEAQLATVERTGVWRGEVWNRRPNGAVYPVLLTISGARDDNGTLTSYIGIFSDISEVKRSEEQLYRLAHTDVLTGLPNRTLLRARMEQSLQRARRNGSSLALLFIDLDLFKNVNDSLGHSVGDALLQKVAEVIRAQVRASDTVSRIGGDEFVILMDGLDEPATAALMAERLCELISQPFEIDRHVLRLTASVGVSLFPNDGDNMENLLSNADLAMYRAKDQGRNNYRFFEAQMSAQATQRLQLETALRGARGNGELKVVYQPQIRLADNRMHGAEALLRWTHPELGEVSPAVFIPLAEEIGVISELGRWVLEQACRQIAEWDGVGLLIPRLSVNVSVQQLERGDFIDEIQGLFEATGVDPDRFELEVTETVLMRNVERVTANLSALKDLGITLAVDDFGSGFSSLSYLKQLPITRLKIDKVFVDGVTLDSNDDAIARAIIALGRALNLETIAEGVETAAQATFLASEGCDEVQGFLFGRPMSADELMTSHRSSGASPTTR